MRVLVYLAGASSELVRVRKWAGALDRAAHVQIAHRWFESADAWAARDRELSRVEQMQVASASVLALRASRVLWLLWPEEPRSTSALIECGYALAHRFHVARNYDVIVSGERAADSVFSSVCDYRSESDAFGFEAVLTHAVRHLPPQAQR